MSGSFRERTCPHAGAQVPTLNGRLLITFDSSLFWFSKPFNKSLYANFDLGLGIIAKQVSSLGDVGVGLRHIAWLQGLAIDFRFHAQFLLQKRDQFAQLDRP